MKIIDIFPWDDHFNTGLPEVDAQHRKLAELLSRLASHLAFQLGDLELNTILEELTAYADYHFTTEEAIWRQFLDQDPSEREHIRGHRNFLDTVRRLQAHRDSQHPLTVSEEVLDFLVRWLAAHILESDREMAHIVLAMRRGLSLQQAKDEAREQMIGANRAMIDIILSIYATLSRNTLHLMRELSEHRQIEHRLQASETRFRLLVHNLPLGVAIMGRSFDIQYTNPAFECLFGMDSGQLVGKFCFNIYENRDTPCDHCPGLAAPGDGPAPRTKTRELHTNNGVFCVRNHAYCYRDEQAEVLGFVEIIEDISEYREAELTLRKQLDELRRWQAVMLDREDRVRELKGEINDLLDQLGKPPRYQAVPAVGDEP